MINEKLQLDSDYRYLLDLHSFGDNGSGYAVAWVDGKKRYLHHLVSQPKKGEVIDHINGDKYDNRTSNLRSVSQKENTRNRRVNKNNKSGHAGIFFDWRINKWLARITADFKSYHLGSFEKIEEAIETRKTAELKFWKKANGK